MWRSVGRSGVFARRGMARFVVLFGARYRPPSIRPRARPGTASIRKRPHVGSASACLHAGAASFPHPAHARDGMRCRASRRQANKRKGSGGGGLFRGRVRTGRLPFMDGVRGLAALPILIRHNEEFWPRAVPHVPGGGRLLPAQRLRDLAAYGERLRSGVLTAGRFMAIRFIRLYPMFLLSALGRVLRRLDAAPPRVRRRAGLDGAVHAVHGAGQPDRRRVAVSAERAVLVAVLRDRRERHFTRWSCGAGRRARPRRSSESPPRCW